MNIAIEPEMIAIPSGPFLMGTRDEAVELLVSQIELARRQRGERTAGSTHGEQF